MDKLTFNVNADFLPIKAHYFLYNGALAGVIPFLSVIAENLGISHEEIGVIFAVLPILSFVGKPFFGFAADHFHKLKSMLMLFLIIIMGSTMGINFIPTPNATSHITFNLSSMIVCSGLGTSLWISNSAYNVCTHNFTTIDLIKCSLECSECQTNESLQIPPHPHNQILCQQNVEKLDIDLEMFQYGKNYTSLDNLLVFNVTNMSVHSQYVQINCSKHVLYQCNANCTPSIDQCNVSQKEFPKNTDILQFWTFFALTVIARVSCGVCASLSDAACFNVLKDKGHLYGKQRLWGTIGWGSSAALTGHLIYRYSSESPFVDHAPGFYILFGLMFLDLIAVYFITMDNVKMSKSILKDVGSLLVKPNVILFIAAVFIIGAFTALLWSFLYLHLKSLEATDDLLGFASGMQCIGELPFFFISGWLIGKIGHSYTLTITLLSFGVRFIAYSYLSNPWWVLPIELLQGLTFGAFYTAMASYASIAAPPGTESTMQGLIGGAFEGLGLAVGALLGGILMERKGGKYLFLYASITAFVSCGLHVLGNIYLSVRNKKSKTEQKKI